MMKRRVSLKNVKLIRMFVIFIFIQLLIICLFTLMFYVSKQVDIQNLKCDEIYVEDAFYTRVAKGSRFVVCSDSESYHFPNRWSLDEYSNYELSESISVGDMISILYFEKYGFGGKTNWVVDARAENEVYRSVDAYNQSKRGLRIVVIITVCIIEILFLGIIFAYVLFHKNAVKQLYCKHKKSRITF